ncbi:MAG: sigma-70 family RNA polymerase sigma factor [Verrucomicrobiales bacterium]|jgi:RNA polymerase sigma-70 factor (ECF subfamily)|nr:sigma-70 family RNA polymerase sigma factor [Verrucomicrobiales bacterium]MBP9224510.1 sigma-70 family RNA polymerase sigma factor [Verrucomicrobiales bacterium]
MSIEEPENTDRTAEADLMKRVAARDHDAFEELSAKYSALIYSTAFKVLNHYEDTEDVMIEVLATIWKKADSFHSKKGSLVTWICTTTRNRSIDRVRSVQRRSALYDRFQEKVGGEIPEARSTGREELYLSDARQVLQTAVVSLSSEQREVIELAYFEGLTQKQIAERIDSPIGTVKARIRRGVERLRVSINDSLNGEGEFLLDSVSE